MLLRTVDGEYEGLRVGDMDGKDDDMMVGTAIRFLVGNTDGLQNGAVVDGRMDDVGAVVIDQDGENEVVLDVGPVLRTLVGRDEVGDEIGVVVLLNSSFVGVEDGAVDGDDVGVMVRGENEGD